MQEIIKYQEIDAKLRKLEGALRSSTNRKNASDMQQYLKDGQAKLIKLEEVAKNISNKYNEATKLYNEFVAKIEAFSKSVSAADEKNAEELLASLSKLVSASDSLEGHIAALQNRIVQVNREVESLMNNAKKARHNLEVYKNSYNSEREKLEPEINKLRAELEAAKKKVKPELLQRYSTKVEGRIFPVFVAEMNNKCGGCRMEISSGNLSSLKQKGFIECENCGRIIYNK